MTSLRLPYPVSANRYWRRAGKFTHVSAEAKEYKRAVATIAATSGQKLISGDVHISIAFLPKPNKDGKPSKVRMDLDNVLKVAIDCLQGIAYANDSQVVSLEASICPPIVGGALIVSVKEA